MGRLVPTEASLMAARCALGEVGSATIRGGRRTVELGPVGGAGVPVRRAWVGRRGRPAFRAGGRLQLDRRSARRPRGDGPAHRARLRARSKRRGVGARHIDWPRADGGESKRGEGSCARGSTLAAGVAVALAGAPTASAAPPAPGGYQQDDFAPGSSFNIAPPGQNGFESTTDILNFLGSGTRPPHQYDQNDMYADLVYETPGLQESQILDYFKDASFGVEPGNVERTYTPELRHDGPTVGRQRALRRRDDRPRPVRGPARLRRRTGPALMFGLGYVTGEDRLLPRRRPAPRGARRPLLASPAAPTSARTRTPSRTRPTWTMPSCSSSSTARDDLYGAEGRADPARRDRTTSTG